jgi:hypothetical protein
MRKTFVVGKLTGRTAEILLLDAEEGAPSAPRLLQALVRTFSPAASPASLLPCSSTVH